MKEDVKELEEVKDVFDDASLEGTEPSSVLTDYSAAFDVLESGYDGEAATTREILAVPIGRPNSQTFFQIHPDLENWSKLVLIFKDRSDVKPGEIDRGETYFCHPSLENVLSTEVARKRIYTLITRFGDLWFWPVKPLGIGRSDRWSQSANRVVSELRGQWIRLTTNMSQGQYEVNRPVSSELFPDPVWPEEGFRNLFNKTVRGRYIENLDHDVIKKLRGLK